MQFKICSLLRSILSLAALLFFGTASAQYCVTNLSSGCGSGDFIQSFSTTGIASSTITANNTGCNSGNNAGFSYNFTQSHSAAPGVTVNFSLTNNPAVVEAYKIWVDWNADFDFLDAGEELYSATLLAGQTVTGSFIVPTGTTGGFKRLRVRCVYNPPSSITACGQYILGEIEDYDFVVSGGSPPPLPCAAPTGLAASGITTSGATLAWTASANAINYEYAINQSTAPPAGSGTAITTTTYAASGLNAATTYYFHLRSICSSGTSAWISVPFTTNANPAPCTAPTGLAASGITSSAATLTWTASTGATGYEYVLNQSATQPTGSGTTVTTTSYPASGLTASTTYYFHLRTRCGMATSAWVTTSFTTSPATGSCLIPNTLTVTNTTSTAVSLSWTAVTGATGYEHANTTTSMPPAAGVAVTTTTGTHSGLIAGGVYYAHVRTKCGTTFSAWRTTQYTKSIVTAVVGLNATDGFVMEALPNPASDVLTVRIDSKTGMHSGHLTLTDVAGRVLRKLAVAGKETMVQLTGLPAGLYLLRYADTERSRVVRVEKL